MGFDKAKAIRAAEKYLASGQMRGIGPAMAKRIVTAFGIDTFEIIEANLRCPIVCHRSGTPRSVASRPRWR